MNRIFLNKEQIKELINNRNFGLYLETENEKLQINHKPYLALMKLIYDGHLEIKDNIQK